MSSKYVLLALETIRKYSDAHRSFVGRSGVLTPSNINNGSEL